MKTRFLSAALAAMLVPAAAMAETETVDGVEWTYRIVNGKAELFGIETYQNNLAIYNSPCIPKNTQGCVTVPSSLGGCPVVLGDWAFAGCEAITEVRLPNGIPAISKGAFKFCIGLTSLVIPDGVTLIDQVAFDGCSSLQSIHIPSSVDTILNMGFRNCSSLENLTFEQGLSTIGQDAFGGCSALKQVFLPEGLVSMEGNAFQDCSGLSTVLIPSTIKSISGGCFGYCSSLVNVIISEGVETIGSGAFASCSSLKQISFPETLHGLGSLSFSLCKNLEKITFNGPFPDGLDDSCVLYDHNCPLATRLLFFSEKYGAEWNRYSAAKLGTVMSFYRKPTTVVELLSTSIRANDPTIMDVVYKVVSSNAMVNVRALAFEKGVRNFANVIRPTTFVEGTGENLGVDVAANVEHTVSWRVSADSSIDLAQMSFEILVSNQGQLPMELVTIPASDEHEAMTVNVRRPSNSEIFNALLWHYANQADDIVLIDGELRWGEKVLAKDDDIVATADPAEYIYDKMGFDLLCGEDLSYVRAATRWPLETRVYGHAWKYGPGSVLDHEGNSHIVTKWWHYSSGIILDCLQYARKRNEDE